MKRYRVFAVTPVVGKFIFFARCTDPVSRVMTRATYIIITFAGIWNSLDILEEIETIELI